VKKFKSQLGLALVCALLGFMLAYKYRILNFQHKLATTDTTQTSELNKQINQLNEQKKKLELDNNDVMGQLKKYEDDAAKQGGVSNNIKSQLDTNRMILGIDDVQGEGITLTLTPKTSFTNSQGAPIQDYDLVYLVNQLRNAGAQAISINDLRIVSQTGIRSSSSNSYILVDDEKVSPKDKIVIKAIGSKSKLQSSVSDKSLNVAKYLALLSYNIDTQASDTVKIVKYNKNYSESYTKIVQ
jgi:Uncharacterized protein conserved in bacteria